VVTSVHVLGSNSVRLFGSSGVRLFLSGLNAEPPEQSTAERS
jgi:hypothetical protein